VALCERRSAPQVVIRHAAHFARARVTETRARSIEELLVVDRTRLPFPRSRMSTLCRWANSPHARAAHCSTCAGFTRAWGISSARHWAIAVALLLVLPTLASGFIFDDYVLLYELGRPRGHEWTGSAPLDLFRWIDPAHFHQLIDGEGAAWWTSASTTIAFLRPV